MPSTKLKNKPKLNSKDVDFTSTSFEAIGTMWLVSLPSDLSKDLSEEIHIRIMAQIGELDLFLSRFRDDSLVSEMAKKAGHYKLPEYCQPMLELYLQLHKISGGLITPLIGKLLDEAGYDKDYSFKPKQLNPVDNLYDVIAIEDDGLLIKKPYLLDFGALGKGLLVDLVSKIIEDYGIQDFCVDAGGDILVRSSEDNFRRIGLEHPDILDEAVGVAQLSNLSLCGSSGNRRRWGGFNHIMNPRTLKSQSNLKAVWATASTTLLADAMTTALYFVGPSELKQVYEFDYFLIKSDYSIEISSGFPGEYFE